MRLRWTSLCNIRRNECPCLIYIAYQRVAPSSTPRKPKLREDVIRGLDESCPLTDQSVTSAGERGMDGSRHCHDVPSPIRCCSGKTEKMRGGGCIERKERLCASHAATGLPLTAFGRESASRRHCRQYEAVLVQQLMQKPSPFGRPDPVRAARLPDKSPGTCAKRACQKRRLRSREMPLSLIHI